MRPGYDAHGRAGYDAHRPLAYDAHSRPAYDMNRYMSQFVANPYGAPMALPATLNVHMCSDNESGFSEMDVSSVIQFLRHIS